MNLSEFLYININQLKSQIGLEDYVIKCYDEIEFANVKPEPNEISIITKKMMPSLTFNTITTPYQILILTEQNSIDQAQALMNRFAVEYNWRVIDEGTSKIKLQFSQPMSMSNFEIIGVGYRSVLYISATTYELQNAVDINNLKIDNEDILPITMSIGYGANMDAQQFPNSEIAKSIKSAAAFNITLVVAAKSTSSTDFVANCLNIMAGSNGNKDFTFNFYIGDIHFNDIALKLTNITFLSAVNDIPSIELGFTM